MWRSMKILILILVVAFVSSSATAHYYRTSGFEAIFPELEGLNILKLGQVVEAVRAHYVDEVPNDVILDGVLKGVLGNLGDPYSAYLDEGAYRQLAEDTSGTFSGIGVHVGMRDGYVTVIAPIKGTPADKAGLRAGDQIIFVDGKDITQGSLEEAVRLIRGPEGHPVHLQVLRDGSLLSFEIVRDNVRVESVEWEMVGSDIGYLRIINFTDNTADYVAEALQAMKSRGATGLLLDLRSNPGGLLHEVLEIATMFVPEGPVLEVVGRDGVRREEFTSSSAGYPYPVVVLIDRGSASASEILAGAISDRGVGTLVGNQTFGKGSVQSILDLKDGTGMKITTALYYTPSGIVIDGNGIEPHVQIDLLEGEVPSSPSSGLDAQVKRALEELRSRMEAPAA